MPVCGHTLGNTRGMRRMCESTEAVERINGSDCQFDPEKVRWKLEDEL